jgi:hypothetical protein
MSVVPWAFFRDNRQSQEPFSDNVLFYVSHGVWLGLVRDVWDTERVIKYERVCCAESTFQCSRCNRTNRRHRGREHHRLVCRRQFAVVPVGGGADRQHNTSPITARRMCLRRRESIQRRNRNRDVGPVAGIAGPERGRCFYECHFKAPVRRLDRPCQCRNGSRNADQYSDCLEDPS